MKTLILFLLASSAALAQQPVINYVFPTAGIPATELKTVTNPPPVCTRDGYGTPVSQCGPGSYCSTLPGVYGYSDIPCGGVAADSLISIYGSNLANTTAVATTYPWPTSLGGTSVVLKGVNKYKPYDFPGWGETADITCRLLYVSPNQINALVPAQQAGWIGLHELSVNSGPGALIEVSATQPALFALANNDAAALHANYKVISASNPTAPGEYILLYATGLAGVPAYGQTNPDLTQSPPDQLAIYLNGIPAKVTYLGHAPGFDGLDQINIQVPPNVFSGGVCPGTSIPVTEVPPGVCQPSSVEVELRYSTVESYPSGCNDWRDPGYCYVSNTVMLPIK